MDPLRHGPSLPGPGRLVNARVRAGPILMCAPPRPAAERESGLRFWLMSAAQPGRPGRPGGAGQAGLG
jgi:hypothetical protein